MVVNGRETDVDSAEKAAVVVFLLWVSNIVEN